MSISRNTCSAHVREICRRIREMSFKSWNSFGDYSAEVRRKNRYIYTPDTEEFLTNVVLTGKERERRIPARSNFWRSQPGNEWKPVFPDSEQIAEEPIPLSPEKMKPFPRMISEGRANPAGINCLYLASDANTAMAEIRPWIGSYASVGRFKTGKDLRIVDCSVHHSKQPLYFLRAPSEGEKTQAVWAHIDRAFSTPVSASDKSLDYAPTQILAELFKNEGYDGIWYKSALSDGFNLALFDIDSATLVNCQLYEVKRIQYLFSESSSLYIVNS